MSGLLSVATGALMANQTVLQTTGNNIANVNTPGYSRQSAVLQTVPSQFTGAGYIGKGVEVATIQRNYDIFLTHQSTLAGATAAGDAARATKLAQLEGIFPGGANGLGAAVNDMLNAFSDVASSPTDLTARTVALTRVNETATRMSGASANLDELQNSLKLELADKVGSINNLAKNIALVNEKVARAQGNGQPPNDLLDQRDQLVRDLNKLVQTSSIPASDGTVGIFIGGSQALVLGNSAASVSLVQDDFGDPLKSKLAITRNGQSLTLDESMLGGGEVPGLLKFQNTDLVEGRNLLGRLTLAVTSSMNDQHKLGLDLDGNVGGNLFTPTNLNTSGNILVPGKPAVLNSGSAKLTLGIADVTQFAASDYQINFSTATAGSVTRLSDGVSTAFQFTQGTALPPPVDGSFKFFNTATAAYDLSAIDGLKLGSQLATAPAAGDRFLLKPFSTAASDIRGEFSNPRALAVASPVAGQMGAANTGSLQLSSLVARSNPVAATPLVLTFIGPNQYIRSDDLNYANYPDPTGLLPAPLPYSYQSGQAIEADLPNNYPATPYTYASSPTNWSVTLQGAPKAGDSVTIQQQPASYRNQNAGNASAMMNLRDVPMFDGAVLTDGYASLMSQIGVRVQSASYSAEVSSASAATLERDRSSVAGVNLDEEAAKLLQYQQAYQASAKVIQIAQSIFDTLIQTISR